LSPKKKTKAKLDKTISTKKWFLISFVILLSGFLIYYFVFRNSEPKFVKEGEVKFLKAVDKSLVKQIDVEVVTGIEEQKQGLMHRSQMEENNGMLFVYPNQSRLSFWMKNTLIPLDIIFIDSKGVIDTIYRKTTPHSETSLPARRNVQFVLEVNGGFSDRFGIKEGDLIEYQIISKN